MNALSIACLHLTSTRRLREILGRARVINEGYAEIVCISVVNVSVTEVAIDGL